MRQGHQNRRGRGRNNNNNSSSSSSSNSSNNNQNRKGQNPLTRTFESNGPDVKIRGTPAHIAEKYISLARDAKSSDDQVLAENYLQHAEHYNRIILAFREQQISQGGDPAAAAMGQRFRVPQLQDGPDDDDAGDDGDDFGSDQQQVMRPNEPQPAVQPPQPFEGGDRQERAEGRDQHRQDGRQDSRQDRPDNRQHGGANRYDDRPRRQPDQFRNRDRDRDRDRGDQRQGDYARQPGPDRQSDRNNERPMDRPVDRPADRPMPVEPPAFVAERIQPPPQPMVAPPVEPGFEPVNGQRPRLDRPDRADRPDRVEGNGPRRRERFQPPAAQQHEQPEFLRRPVRRPRRDAAPTEGGEPDGNVAAPAAPPVRDDGSSTD